MYLTVWLPESAVVAAPAALAAARFAPIFHRIDKGEGGAKAYLAVFADLPVGLDVALRLIGEIVDLPDVRMGINGRRVVSVTKFWNALLCYRDSLWEQDKEDYCARQADRVGEAAGCPVWTCQARCQFICACCFQVVRKSGAPPVADQLREIALQAEVEWCPNLQLP